MAGRSIETLRTALIAVIGAAHVLTDDDVRAGYETDWTNRWHGRCAAVARPADTAEVSAILRVCSEHGAAVIPQGGNTGLVGGSVPRSRTDPDRPTIVLSTRRLDTIDPVDAAAMQVTLGAGVTIAAWQAAARRAGLDAPIDFAARESATIGGAIATNAGGSRVLRFGTMRRQVVGVQAVLAHGQVVGSLAGLPKETVGFHWPSLVAGSEGTLAVVTAARLALVPRFAYTATALVSLTSLDAALALLADLRAHAGSLDAVELLLPEATTLVSAHLGRALPVTPGAAMLLIECAGHHDPTGELTAALSGASGIVDSAIATDASGRTRLVDVRDRVTEAIAAEAARRAAPVVKLDVAVPLAALGRLIGLARTAALEVGAELIPFGHLAEGNLHLNALSSRPGHGVDAAALAERILPAVAELGGTISAEHGIGVAKAPWLPLVRSPAELAVLAAVRTAFDPARLLNPGVLEPGASAQVP